MHWKRPIARRLNADVPANCAAARNEPPTTCGNLRPYMPKKQLTLKLVASLLEVLRGPPLSRRGVASCPSGNGVVRKNVTVGARMTITDKPIQPSAPTNRAELVDRLDRQANYLADAGLAAAALQSSPFIQMTDDVDHADLALHRRDEGWYLADDVHGSDPNRPVSAGPARSTQPRALGRGALLPLQRPAAPGTCLS
jgi:hypothetical protein